MASRGTTKARRSRNQRKYERRALRWATSPIKHVWAHRENFPTGHEWLEGLKLLHQLADAVGPMMRMYGIKILHLTDTRNPAVWGRHWPFRNAAGRFRGGRLIELNLYKDSGHVFRDWDDLVGTLLHELAHY